MLSESLLPIGRERVKPCMNTRLIFALAHNFAVFEALEHHKNGELDFFSQKDKFCVITLTCNI